MDLKKTVSNTNTVMPTEEVEKNGLDDTESFRAYFTTIPPLKPQRLVLVGDMPDKTQIPERMQQFLGNILKINYYDGIEFKTQRQNLSHLTAGSEETLENKATRIHKRRSRKIRQLLYQLIANLPVFDSTRHTRAVIQSESAISLGTLPQSRALQSSLSGIKISSPVKQRSYCNTAVQVRYLSPQSSNENLAGKDDWLGGVRALRDSHVRLVQRQLRHIERLNRALDRVTRSNTNKAPVKQIHV